MPDFDCCALRTVVDDPINGPLVTVPKHRAGRDLHDGSTFQHDNPDLDPVRVAKWRTLQRRSVEIEDDVDALLLDAEGRDLGKTGRLDAPHGGVERALAAPLLKQDGQDKRADGETGSDPSTAAIWRPERRSTLTRVVENSPARSSSPRARDGNGLKCPTHSEIDQLTTSAIQILRARDGQNGRSLC
jgi:hypothetical protein